MLLKASKFKKPFTVPVIHTVKGYGSYFQSGLVYLYSPVHQLFVTVLADTHEIVPIHEGEIVSAEIGSIRRGVRGSAGEIRGYLGGEELGVLEKNTLCGAYGQYTSALPTLKEYETAPKQEIRQGKAKILCTVQTDGRPRLYDVVIKRINYSGDPAKNMIITVTDEKLLKETGGIIQGMSGSPLIQNGKFIGAVTHVFVNDPTSGYAIFAENMLRQQEDK